MTDQNSTARRQQKTRSDKVFSRMIINKLWIAYLEILFFA